MGSDGAWGGVRTGFLALLALSLCLPALDLEKKKFDVEGDGFKRRVKSVKVSSFTIEEKFRK